MNKHRTSSYNKVLEFIYTKTNKLRGNGNGNRKRGLSKRESSVLYPDPGSNRDGLPQRCLRPSRLPIPPSGRCGAKLDIFYGLTKNELSFFAFFFVQTAFLKNNR